MLGRPLGRAGGGGVVARLRSFGCRASAVRNYAVADLTEKSKRGCVSTDSTGEEAGGRGHVARLRSVGCRAGAAPELRRGRFNRKGEARMRFARFDGRGKTAGAYCPASFCRMPRRRGPELRRGRFSRKGEARMRFAFSAKSGGAYRGRTDDLLHAMQAL